MLFDGKNFVVKTDEGTVDVICGKVIFYTRGGDGGSSGGGSVWGQITGTLSDQTDLQSALNAKVNANALRGMAYVPDAPQTGNEYARKDGGWVVASGGGSVWGQITGTLTDQTDLKSALDNKLDHDVIAPEWMSSETVSYAIGDLVIYQGKLYQFVSASENPWKYADVDEVTFTEWAPGDYEAGTYLTHADGYYRAKKDLYLSTWPSPPEISYYFDVLSVDEFNPTQNYSIGDVVIHESKTFVFMSAYTAESGWDPSKVVLVTVESLLAEKIGDAPSDGHEYARKNGTWSIVSGGGGGGGAAVWGDITGTLANQTDLQNALNAKADASSVYTKTAADALLSAKANSADLGDLATQDSVDYQTEVTNKPTLGTMAAVNDAPSDGSEYVRKNGAWAVASGGGVVSAAWGQITGTLANQTDLQSALTAKANTADLGDLATQDSVDYATDVTNKPTLGGIQVRPDYEIVDSTNEPTDGVTSLATGKIIFVYEA